MSARRRAPPRNPLRQLDDQDELGAVLSGTAEAPRNAAPEPSTPALAPPEKGKPNPRQHITFRLPEDVRERLKNAVSWCQHHGMPGVTINGVVEGALRAEVERLEKEHNRGKPFPPRTEPPRTGRPIS